MQSLGLAPLSTSSSVLFEILFLLAFDQKSDTMRQCSLGRAVMCYLFFFALPATRIFSFAIFCDAVLSKSWQDKFFQTALFTWPGIFFCLAPEVLDLACRCLVVLVAFDFGFVAWFLFGFTLFGKRIIPAASCYLKAKDRRCPRDALGLREKMMSPGFPNGWATLSAHGFFSPFLFGACSFSPLLLDGGVLDFLRCCHCKIFFPSLPGRRSARVLTLAAIRQTKIQ